MAFELKNNEGKIVTHKHDFTTKDFEVNSFQTDELCFSFPFGDMKGRQWIFDGMRMIYSESDYTDFVELDWKGDTEMINMHFNLKGKISFKDLETQKSFDFSNNQHNIFYGKEAEGKMKIEELKSKMFMVQLSKDAFFRIADNGNDALKRFAESVANNKSVAFSETNLHIDFALLHCIGMILNCPYSDALKRMFLHSKTIEMLVLQAEAFDKTLTQKPTILKTQYDKERILFARDYLVKNIETPPSLTELSRIAGINEFKLKRGFKETFDLTVFQYLADVRLGIAQTDLQEGKKSATEIAMELGYSSVQHFSTAFKKKFGVSPNHVK